MGNAMTRYLVLVPILILLASCSDEITADDVVGQYVWQKEDVKAVLTLQRYFSYSYRVSGPDGEFSRAGRWILEAAETEPAITFGDFDLGGIDTNWRQWKRGGPGPDHYTPSPGLWYTRIERTLFGGVSLCFHQDGSDACFVLEET